MTPVSRATAHDHIGYAPFDVASAGSARTDSIFSIAGSPPRLSSRDKTSRRPAVVHQPFQRSHDALADVAYDLNARLVKATRHPLRRRILVALTAREASPRQLADEFEQPTNLVAHHFKVLRELGLIELVRTERRRGGLSHVYRGAGDLISDTYWRELPVSLRRATFRQTLEMIAEDLRQSSQHGGLDHPEAHISRVPLELDEQGFDEVRDIVNDALARVMEANARASRRRAHGESERVIRTRAAFLHFHEGDNS